jgi:hypothetical protein
VSTKVTIDAKDLLMLCGSEFNATDSGDFPNHGVFDVALTAILAAAADLRVLCNATSDDGVDGEDLGMMLLRMSYKLEAVYDVLWKHQKGGAS